ncbi:MAG: sigma-70 family RNA polymerase sigma factor [Pyrinomonadaceae bacterium]
MSGHRPRTRRRAVRSDSPEAGKFFEWRGSTSPDEHADETINRVARKIAEGEVIQNLQSYFYGVARLLFMESLKEREREQAAIDQLPEPIQAAEESGDSDSRLECFEQCVRSLPAENRELIVEYYQEEKRAKIDQRKVLAEKLGMPLNALRIRAHRIRVKLEDCVHECVKK